MWNLGFIEHLWMMSKSVFHLMKDAHTHTHMSPTALCTLYFSALIQHTLAIKWDFKSNSIRIVFDFFAFFLMAYLSIEWSAMNDKCWLCSRNRCYGIDIDRVSYYWFSYMSHRNKNRIWSRFKAQGAPVVRHPAMCQLKFAVRFGDIFRNIIHKYIVFRWHAM